MSSPAMQRNSGAYVEPVYAAAASGSTSYNGVAIDRNALGSLYLSAKVAVPYEASLGAGATDTFTIAVQDGASSTAFDDYAEAQSVVIGDASSTGAQTLTGAASVDVDLSGARQYVRVVIGGASGSTSVTAGAAVMVMGGGDVRL